MKVKFFIKAKEEATKSSHQHKIGAVLVSGGRILSTGYNQIRHLKVGKRYTNYDCSLHAERACLSKVDKEVIVGADLYIYRMTKDGIPALSKPCSQCNWMIQELGIKRVFYTTDSFPFWEKLKIIKE